MDLRPIAGILIGCTVIMMGPLVIILFSGFSILRSVTLLFFSSLFLSEKELPPFFRFPLIPGKMLPLFLHFFPLQL